MPNNPTPPFNVDVSLFNFKISKAATPGAGEKFWHENDVYHTGKFFVYQAFDHLEFWNFAEILMFKILAELSDKYTEDLVSPH